MPAVNARAAGQRPGVAAAAAQAVFRPVLHPGGVGHAGTVAVLRRAGSLPAGQRGAGRADRRRELRGVDDRPAQQRQLHRAGLRADAAGSDPADRAAPLGRHGAGHHGVLRRSRSAAGPLRRTVDRADGRNSEVQPRPRLQRRHGLRRRGRGARQLGQPNGGQRGGRRGARRHRPRTAVPGGGAELGHHRAGDGRRGNSARRAEKATPAKTFGISRHAMAAPRSPTCTAPGWWRSCPAS